MSLRPRQIVCAAIKLRDGRIVCGVRHFDQLMLQVMPPNTPEGRAELSGHQQGFVDNDFQFLDRGVAWRVALKAGQVDPNSPTKGTLYSEDLY